MIVAFGEHQSAVLKNLQHTPEPPFPIGEAAVPAIRRIQESERKFFLAKILFQISNYRATEVAVALRVEIDIIEAGIQEEYEDICLRQVPHVWQRQQRKIELRIDLAKRRVLQERIEIQISFGMWAFLPIPYFL